MIAVEPSRSGGQSGHVEAIGRITAGCLGLYSDENEAALKPILASVRKHSKAAVAMQLAHAGRKGSSHRPWEGGQQIAPNAKDGWQTVAPSALAHKEGRQLQALVGEALADLIEKRKMATPRAHVMGAYLASHEKYGSLYKKLAE